MPKQNKSCLQEKLADRTQTLKVIKTIAIISAKKDSSVYMTALAMSKLHAKGRHKVLVFIEEFHPELIEHIRKADECRLAAFRLGLRGSIEQGKEQLFLNGYDPKLLSLINLEMGNNDELETIIDIIDDSTYYRSDIFGERELFRRLDQQYIDNDIAYKMIMNYLENISDARTKLESIASLRKRIKKMAVRGNDRERALALKVEDVFDKVENELLPSTKRL